MSALSVNNSLPAQNNYLNPIGKDKEKEDEKKKVADFFSQDEPKDEYIPSGDKPEDNSVKYRLLENEKGDKRIVEVKPENKPEGAEPAERAGKPEVNSNGKPAAKPKEETVMTAVSTDKVEAEIKNLKQRLQQIQQRINSASDEKARAAAEKEFAQVSAELSAKDNEGYRRANASVTTH